MDKKKFKILMIVDIVLIIGLFALMMVLKGYCAHYRLVCLDDGSEGSVQRPGPEDG